MRWLGPISLLVLALRSSSALDSPSLPDMDSSRPLASDLDTLRARIFDADTPESDLAALIRTYPDDAHRHPTTGHAECRLSLSQALFVHDRITDGSFPPDLQTELLRHLLTKLQTKLFFAAIVTSLGQTRERRPGRYELAPILSPTIVADITDLGLDHVLASIPKPIRDVVTYAVHQFSSASRWRQCPLSAQFTSGDVARLRALYPPPFDQVYPDNRAVARAVFHLLGRQTFVNGHGERRPLLSHDGLIPALILLGLRPDHTCLLPMGLRPDDPLLAAVVALARPDGHLFEDLGDGGRGPLQHGVRVRDPSFHGLVKIQLLLDHLPLVPVLVGAASFRAYLRRHPGQLRGAASSMAAHQRWPFFDVLARARTLAHGEFESLANDVVDFLIHDGSKVSAYVASGVRDCPYGWKAAFRAPPTREPTSIGVRPETLIALLTLPHVHLFRPNLSSHSPLYYLLNDIDRFGEVVFSAAFLGRLVREAAALRDFYDRSRAQTQERLRSFLRRIPDQEIRLRLAQLLDSDSDDREPNAEPIMGKESIHRSREEPIHKLQQFIWNMFGRGLAA